MGDELGRQLEADVGAAFGAGREFQAWVDTRYADSVDQAVARSGPTRRRFSRRSQKWSRFPNPRTPLQFRGSLQASWREETSGLNSPTITPPLSIVEAPTPD